MSSHPFQYSVKISDIVNYFLLMTSFDFNFMKPLEFICTNAQNHSSVVEIQVEHAHVKKVTTLKI